MFIFLIAGLRPLFGPAICKYYPTCTRYAIEQLQTQSLIRACWNIIKRVVTCI